jgi:hypothetical protein
LSSSFTSYFCSPFIASALASDNFFLWSITGGFVGFFGTVPAVGWPGAGFLISGCFYAGFTLILAGVLGTWLEFGFSSTFSWLACSFFSSCDYPSFFSCSCSMDLFRGFFSPTILLLLRVVTLTRFPVAVGGLFLTSFTLLLGLWSWLLYRKPLLLFGEEIALLLTIGVFVPPCLRF